MRTIVRKNNISYLYGIVGKIANVINMDINDIYRLIQGRKIEQAYDAVLGSGLGREVALSLFQQVLGINWNLFLLHDRAGEMKAGAERGDLLLRYAWARYNDAVRPSPDSVETAIEYYTESAEGGVPDALMCLAFLWKEGAFGLVDMSRFRKLRQEAVDKGSTMAVLSLCTDRVFGLNGEKADPRGVYDKITSYIGQSSEEGIYVDPRFHSLVAASCKELGRVLEADSWYSDALSLGDPKACFYLACLRGTDRDGNFVDTEEFGNILAKGEEMNIPDAHMVMPLILTEELFEGLPQDERALVPSTLESSLTTALALGEPLAAYFLGTYYYEGKYGFRQDFAEAWKRFSQGAILNYGPCYEMLAQMLLQDEAPEGSNDDMLHHYELCALRLGCDGMLGNVVRAYRNGFLGDYAAEIEQYYLPEYEEDEFYDEFDDDGRFDAWA